ncbi:MAG: hypothetical protein LBT93_07410 [Treponema sp.]|nr:hypothetical protein [Treponema sp.]
MKRSLLGSLVFIFFALLFVSCASLPFSSRKSWSVARLKKPGPTVRLENVSVDRPGGWVSIEEELANLTPLLLLDRGFLVSADPEETDYAADVRAWERDYTQGWKTKRSIVMEVRFWKEAGPDSLSYQGTPLAAGRVTYQGKKSLVSSRINGPLLKSALKKAMRALRLKNPSQGTPL